MAVFPHLEAATPAISDHRRSPGLYTLGVLVGVRCGELAFVGYVVARTGVSFWFSGPGGTLWCCLSLPPWSTCAPNTLRLGVAHFPLCNSAPGCSMVHLRPQLQSHSRESALCPSPHPLSPVPRAIYGTVPHRRPQETAHFTFFTFQCGRLLPAITRPEKSGPPKGYNSSPTNDPESKQLTCLTVSSFLNIFSYFQPAGSAGPTLPILPHICSLDGQAENAGVSTQWLFVSLFLFKARLFCLDVKALS